MKKVIAFILSLMLLVAFTFAIGCKKQEEMAPAEQMTPAEAPATEAPAAGAPAPAEEAPAPAPEQAPEQK